MNIFYDFELDDEYRYLTDNTELSTFFKELKEFIEQRLFVLKDKIDKEETSGAKMIVIMALTDTNFKGLVYSGYSNVLTDKMKTCITGDDIEYLKRRFSERDL